MLNAEKTTPEERIARIKAETNGRGAEIVVECVGRPEVFPEGLKYLRKAGMYLEQAARFRPSRKTAVRLKKTGGHGASTPSSRICTIKSVACQTIPRLFFSISKTRSTN